jgi:hypothetical protein
MCLSAVTISARRASTASSDRGIVTGIETSPRFLELLGDYSGKRTGVVELRRRSPPLI